VAVKIPALLEITDRLVASADHDTGETARVEMTLLQLESSLLDWFEAWAALHPSRTPLATALADLKATSEPYAALCFGDSLIAALLWCLLLLLHDSVYALTKSLPSAIHSVPEWVSPERANKYATLLSQSVYHLYQQAGAPLSKALAVSAPLHFVIHWYSRVCGIEKVERCIALEDDLRRSAPYLDWDIALFWGFLPVYWLLDEVIRITRSIE
jgi:hypothetical protein